MMLNSFFSCFSWTFTHCARLLIAGADFVRPVLGNIGACRFSVNCMDVARISFAIYPVHKAFLVTAQQLAYCHPLAKPQRYLVKTISGGFKKLTLKLL